MSGVPADATSAPPPAVSAAAPLCETHLHVVVRAGGVARRPPGACQSEISFSARDRSFDARFRGPRRGSSLPPAGWTTHFAHGPQSGPRAWDSRTLPGNHEQQIYVDPGFAGTGAAPLGLSPFLTDRHGLRILARPTPREFRTRLWDYRYVSGLITSRDSFAQRYGYFEVRARLPAGRGLWPAVWLLPSAGGWPPELDLLEQTGGETIYQTAHTAASGRPSELDFTTRVRGAASGLHTYGVLWTPERLVWFVDRRQTAAAATPADMDQPMYLLINLAVGGDFAGSPSRTIRWPARFRIARVSAYRWPPEPVAETR